MAGGGGNKEMNIWLQCALPAFTQDTLVVDLNLRCFLYILYCTQWEGF